VVDLHPHQIKAIEELGNGKILYGGVGVGKSRTVIGYFVSKVCGGEYGVYGSMQTPKDIIVITTAKKRDSLDWEDEAIKFNISPIRQFSIDGVKLTVDSWNNIGKYTEVKDAFFVFDEQRVVGYGAWTKAFVKIAKSNEWVLLSATPGDTWLDYIPVFIANGWYKHKTDFTDQHVVWVPRVKYPKVQRYLDTPTLVRRRNEVLVHMPFVRTTTRHAVDVYCDYDQELFDKVVKKRWHVFESRPLRDAGEMFGVMRKVVNSDTSRLSALRDLQKKHPRLIVFYNFDYELEMLRTLSPPRNDSTGSSETTSSTSTAGGERTLDPSSKTDGTSTSSESTTSASTTASSTSQEKTTRSPSSSTDSVSPHTVSTGCDEHRCRGECVPAWKELPSTTILSENERREEWPNTSTLTSSSSTPEPSLESTSQTRKSGGSGSTHGGRHLTVVKSSPETAQPRGTDGELVVAEWNGHNHDAVPTTARWLYLVQYRAGAEGWNCIDTDAMVFFSQTYSYRDWWQAHGRIDRLNTPFKDLYYYHLISKSIIDKAIRKALRTKKSFNERNLRLPNAA
jgi:hypothetical protein